MATHVYNVTSPQDVNQSVDLHLEQLRGLRDQFRIAAGIIAPHIALFGSCGNLISIAVLTRRWLRSSTNCYLTALAVYDILYLIFVSILFMSNLGDLKANDYYIHVAWIVRPCCNVFSNTATWLTVTFTVERYVGVSSPIKGRVICTVERAKCIITCVCIASFMFTLPDFFEYQLIQFTNEANVTHYTIMETPAKEVLQTIGYFWIVPVLFTFIPLLLLVVFNSLLISSVMEASKFRRENAGSMIDSSDHRRERQQREQQRITVMLIAVVLVFLTCQLPSAILFVISKVYETSSFHERYRQNMAAAVFNLLIMINSSANFILYSVFSTKFRKTFKRMFCRCMQDNAAEQLLSEIPTRGSRPSVTCSPNNTVTSLNKNGYLQIVDKQNSAVL